MSEKVKKEDKGKNKFILMAAALVVLVAGIGIYRMPMNRLERQLETAYKYLEDEAHKEAALAFEQATAIDERCIEAYVGGVEAYLGTEKESEIQDFYDRALIMLSEQDMDFISANIDSVMEIYLAVDEIYNGDGKMLGSKGLVKILTFLTIVP